MKNKLRSGLQTFKLTASEKDYLQTLRSILGFTPRDLHIYQLAFKHKSISQHPQKNNERLEFLGDAILSAVLTDYIYQQYPNKKEGELSDLRSKVERRAQLNKLAKELELEKLIDTDPALQKSQQLPKKFILGNTLEAFIGAIYIDKGYNTTRHFILNKLFRLLDFEHLLQKETNYKGRLLEWAQKHQKKVRFEVHRVQTIKHRKMFDINVRIEDQLVGSGADFNKKNAEQLAAEEACKDLNILK